MAYIDFTFDQGKLTIVTPSSRTIVSSGDYTATLLSDGSQVEISPTRVDPRLKTYKLRNAAEGTINSTAYATTALFVEAFNEISGTRFGFNTQYGQHIISLHLSPDTSTDLQILPDLHKAGYVTITASADNTGEIVVSDSTISHDDTECQLEAGDSVYIEIDDLSKIYMYSTVPTDIVNISGVFKD